MRCIHGPVLSKKRPHAPRVALSSLERVRLAHHVAPLFYRPGRLQAKCHNRPALHIPDQIWEERLALVFVVKSFNIQVAHVHLGFGDDVESKELDARNDLVVVELRGAHVAPLFYRPGRLQAKCHNRPALHIPDQIWEERLALVFVVKSFNIQVAHVHLGFGDDVESKELDARNDLVVVELRGAWFDHSQGLLSNQFTLW